MPHEAGGVFRDAGDIFGEADGGIEVAELVDHSELERLRAGEDAAIGVVLPIGDQFLGVFGVAVAFFLAATFDDAGELFVGGVDEILQDFFLFIAGGLRRVEGRKHIFVGAALKGDRLHSDFVHQPVKIDGLHNDADGTGDGKFVGDDEPTRRGDVIAAGRRHAAHRGDDGFAGVGLELHDGVVDFIGGKHFAAGRIDAKDDGFDAFIAGGEVKLFLDARHHVLLGAEAVAGDDAGDRHDGDALRGFATAHDGFGVKIGGRGQRIHRLAHGGKKPAAQQKHPRQREKQEHHHPTPRAAGPGLMLRSLGQNRWCSISIMVAHAGKPTAPRACPQAVRFPLTLPCPAPTLPATGRFWLMEPDAASRF